MRDRHGCRAAAADVREFRRGKPPRRRRSPLAISGLLLYLAAAAAAFGISPPRELPRLHFVIRYTPGAGFLVFPPAQGAPLVDINSVALRVYDPSHNWLRIEATPGQSGTHTPSDANQVFGSIFDPSANALHVTCLTGCGAVFGTDISALDSSHQKVVGFGGIPVSSAAPSDGEVYQYSATRNEWAPANTINLLGNGTTNDFVGWLGNTWAPMAVTFTNLAGVASSGQLPAASSSAIGALQLTGDLGGQAAVPRVLGTHLSSPLSIVQGGTGLASGGQSGQCLTSTGSSNAWTYCLPNPLNTTIHVDGQAFTSVAQAEATLPPGSAATVYDDICGDTFAADPFNSGNLIYLRLILARCSQPYVLSVPLKIGTLQQLIGSGRGVSGSTVAGTLLQAGAGFPLPVASAPAAPHPSATTAGCTAYPAAGTYYAELTYVNAAGETPPSAESTGVALNGTTQCLLIASPASTGGATQYRVYASSASGAEVYQGTASLGQSVTLSLVTTTGNSPATVNSTGALITLGSAVPGSASLAFDARVEDLSVDCNGGAQSIAVYNALGQEGSGAFQVDAQNCAGAAAFVAEGYNGGKGANNSAFERLIVGDAKLFTCGSGASACNPTYCVLVDGVNSLRHVEGLSCTPNSGVTVAGVEVKGASSAGPASQGTTVRDVHCEGQAGTFNSCVEGIGAQLSVDHLTTSSGTLDSVHLDAASFDSTVADVVPYSGSHYGLLDSINAYTSPGGQRIGFYAVGSAPGQFLSDDATLAAGKVYASPASASGPATYRSLAGADLGLTAQGDLLTLNGSGSLTRLGEGSNGQCLSVSAGNLAWSSTCGGGGAGGSNLQLEANNGGALAGVPGTGVNLATGAVGLQPASGQDAVPLTLAPSIASPTADIFDVYKDSGKTTKAVWVDASGNFNFSGNNATYGGANQAAQSFLSGYGGTGTAPLPPYIALHSGALSPPSLAAPVVANSGGSLGTGNYCFKITYVNAAGETPGSNELCATLSSGSANKITITSPSPAPGVAGYDVYEGATASETIQNVASGNCALSGSACAIGSSAVFTSPFGTGGRLVPGANTTGAGYATYLTAAGSVNGVACVSSTVPSGDCAGGSGVIVTDSGSPASGSIARFTSANNIAPAAASDIVNLFSSCAGAQYLGADGNCHTASGGGGGTVTSSGSPSSGNVAKFTAATNIAPAAASDIVSLFASCSGAQYLGADGSCHSASGGGTVTSVGLTAPVQYSVSGSPVASSGTLGVSFKDVGTSNASDINSPYEEIPGIRRQSTFLANAGPGFNDFGDAHVLVGAALSGVNPTSTDPFMLQQSVSGTADTVTGQQGELIHYVGRGNPMRFRWYGGLSSASAAGKYLGCISDQTLQIMVDDSGAHDSKAKGNYACIEFDTSGAYVAPPVNATTDYVCLTNGSGGSNSSQDAVDSGVAATSGGHRFEILEGATWKFYIDSNLVCSLPAAGNVTPAAGTIVRMMSGGEGFTTTAFSVSFAYLWISEDYK